MNITHTAVLLAGLSLATAGFAQVTLLDQFNDGNFSTNTLGVGTGFNSYGTATPTESGGMLSFNAGAGNTFVINSKDTLNPLAVGSWTTVEFKFGAIAAETGTFLHRLWVGYRPASDTSNHFLGSGAISVAIVHQDNGDIEPYHGFVSANGQILAGFNWSSLSQLSNLRVTIATSSTSASSTSYEVSFSDAIATPTVVFGSLSGTFTPTTTVSNGWSVSLHSQTEHALLDQLDSVTVSPIPEPSTYAALFGAAALGCVVLRRRRQQQAA